MNTAPDGDSPADSPDVAGGLDRLIGERRAKAAALRAEGVDPFPNRFPGRRSIEEVRSAGEGLEPGAQRPEVVRVAGRLVARRGQGKMAFLDVEDRSGRIQVMATSDGIGEDQLEHLVRLDLGDLIGVSGPLIRTRRGELSIGLT